MIKTQALKGRGGRPGAVFKCSLYSLLVSLLLAAGSSSRSKANTTCVALPAYYKLWALFCCSSATSCSRDVWFGLLPCLLWENAIIVCCCVSLFLFLSLFALDSRPDLLSFCLLYVLFTHTLFCLICVEQRAPALSVGLIVCLINR